MQTRKPRLVLAATLMLSAAAALGGEVEDRLRATLIQRLPGLTIESITKLPQLDLYEVVGNGNRIFYTDAKGEFGLMGNLIDLKTRANLTQQRQDELNVVDFAQLPLDKAIVKVKGDGSRKIAIFTDPDCPFCKRVENDLAKLDNVTIYMFLYPIESLHPGAPEVAKRIWCSPDKVKAWDDYMSSKVRPSAAPTCDNPVDKIVEYGRKKNINGTPTLIFATGERVPGAISAAQIETLLNAKAN